jgi:hypothetical protein
MRRELAIALRAWPAWIVAALSALLVGHGFVLAVDLFTASSRSAIAAQLQAREMDPLAGVIRPTLGGVDLALALLGPVVATRGLAAEKERRSFIALCIHSGSIARVLARKAAAAAIGLLPAVLVPVLLFAAWAAAGAHVDVPETAVAMSGAVLHLALVVAVSTAAAAFTRTTAQAISAAVAASLASWAIDAADGFAALAWLGGASRWSIDRHLSGLERGVVPIGDVAWVAIFAAAAFGLAIAGASFLWSRRTRVLAAAAVAVAALALLAGADRWRRAWDWTEGRRASLPPAAVAGLRAIDRPIAVVVHLDREDGRRRQLESDVLAKLVLARPDVVVRAPLDERPAAAARERDEDYGRIEIHVGDAVRETRSTSRREIVTLIFEASGQPLPDWSMPPYPGYPVVVDGAPRTSLLAFAYVVLPSAMIAIGALATRRRARRVE